MTEIPEPYSFHDNKKKSWISNNETKTERRVDPELQTLTKECATEPLYKNMAVNCVFQVLPLLRYGNVGEAWFNRNRAHPCIKDWLNQSTRVQVGFTYGVHGGYLYLLQLMSELLTRFYWVSSESLWQKFLNRIAFMITKRKAEFRTMRQRPREEWIQNYRLWPKSARQNLYTRTWLLTVSFKCYLYYDTETSVRPGLIETVLIRASKTG